jgi:hypothetical protein
MTQPIGSRVPDVTYRKNVYRGGGPQAGDEYEIIVHNHSALTTLNLDTDVEVDTIVRRNPGGARALIGKCILTGLIVAEGEFPSPATIRFVDGHFIFGEIRPTDTYFIIDSFGAIVAARTTPENWRDDVNLKTRRAWRFAIDRRTITIILPFQPTGLQLSAQVELMDQLTKLE